MLQDFKEGFKRWGNTTTERQKLQHTYLVITLLVILVAGIVSLINAHAGHDLTYIALASIGIFVINALIWNLLNSIVISKLPQRAKKK